MSHSENPEILPTALLDILNELHSQYKSLKDGVVANYIPQLAKVNPDLLRICIVTTVKLVISNRYLPFSQFPISLSIDKVRDRT